ncbi:multiple epidermal growth factor-like domains protein 11 [Acanthaster planci]|uniref:Multiple epidermal growth factor-like domains protein 11 n=1 Tax=Acanthaster planci TaxID=133434 RepID=A0A8B7ZT58_ACAPL|nr:multiple epidermal growth factor-like domains protein 11 [Acanthaster planci]
MLRVGAVFVVVELCLSWGTGVNAQVDANGTYMAVNLTQEEKDVFLGAHNELRAKVDPEAANMMYMKWDESLALMAQAWSAECIWEHGQPTPNISPFTRLGQNLYLITGYGNRPSGKAVSTAWYNEIRHYTFETGACESGKACGHYTQLAWATSYALGCGMDFCESADKTDYDNVWIVTCNYGPTGNVGGLKPYKPGPNCTKCDSGVGECYNSLCRLCSDHTEKCVCAQACESCGELNSTSCSCKCPNGFQGTDCADICEDFDSRCGVLNGGYPKPWCWDETAEDHEFMLATCPATCELCVVEQDPDSYCPGVPTLKPPTTPGPTPTPKVCVPLDCQNGGVYDEETCECKCPPQYQGELCDKPKPTLEQTSTQPTECPLLDCQNGGKFDEEACKCRCFQGYQGKLCQHSKEDIANGVVIILSADFNRWGEMEPIFKTGIAESLTTHCNDNFEVCCPDRGSKTTSEKFSYANESDILVASGYPEPSEDIENEFSTMFLARELGESELCVKGGSPTTQSRQKADTEHAMYERDATPGG